MQNDIGEFIALYMGSIAQLTLYAYQVFSDPEIFPDIGCPTRDGLNGCLSRVTGNCHARFLGGLGLVTAPGYPVCGGKVTTDTDQKYIDDLVTHSEDIFRR